ncbi:MAG TPA: carboxypeptidase-like regulatory domain-containing protein [Bryobacteraceae bacterium]|nr:carboxypeptidase-like regulatory domain-containing protein [Bryobacteraceae bacterium]
MSRLLWLSAIAALVLSHLAVGQSTLGVIRGRTLDPSGAPIPNLAVRVVNTGTNIEKAVVSDESGLFEATYLQPGAYNLTAEAAGFPRCTVEGLVLSAGATVRADLKFVIGEVSSSVTVAAGAPVINTETAVIADIKTQEQYLSAPLNNRGYWDSYVLGFMSLVPGAQPMSASYNISFAGSRATMQNFTVDGVTTVSTLSGGGPLGPNQPSMDYIREVKVDLSGSSAEYSSPGYVNVVTRGGENQFHGSAFEYYNTAGFNARNFFANRVAFNVMNNFGGSISGPVRRNKTFFSAAFEGFNNHSAAQITANLPSERVRSGDFSRLMSATGTPLTIKDPANNGAPFPGAVIPASRISATSQKIQTRFFPATNYGGEDNVTGSYRDLWKQVMRKEQVDFRIDHQFSSRNSLFGRFSAARLPNGTLEGGLPTIGARKQRRQARNFILSDTHTFTPTLINEFRFGLVRGYNPYSGPVNGPEIVKELGLTNLPADLPNVEALPTISISGYQGISQIIYWRPAEMIYQWQDNISWIHGRHTVKMGADIWRNYGSNYAVSPSSAFGSVNFTGSMTGYGYADFLLGVPYQASRSSTGFEKLKSMSVDKFFFIQDDFKVSPRLTLNFGLRYELNPPYTEQNDTLANFNPFTGQLVVPNDAVKSKLAAGFLASKLVPIVTAEQAGLPARTLAFTDKNNFAPRLGLAYKLTEDSRTVFRSSFGTFYDSFTGLYWRGMTGGPFNGNEVSPVNSYSNGMPLWQFPNMFPTVLSQTGTASLTGIDPHTVTPAMHQWNATLEREITGGMGLRVSYIGSATRHLALGRNLNQPVPGTVPYSAALRPYPNLSTVTYRDSSGNAKYHAMTVVLERKMKNGLQFQASHTWAKNLTDAHGEDENGGSMQNAYDRKAEWGNYAAMRRHRFIFSSMYELPFAKLGPDRRWFKGLAGGWSLSSFVLLQTGPYFSPTFSGLDPANVGTSSGRADRISDGNLSGGTIYKWFDTTAFAVPTANSGRFGNSGVNILRAPGTANVDLGLYKSVQVSERMRVRLEGTLTNALNHPNFAAPASNISLSSAGVITATQGMEGAGARTARFGARLDF